VVGDLQQLRQVAARAERALSRSGDDEHAGVVVGRERVDGLGEVERHLDVDGVGGVLPVQRELRDVPELLDGDRHVGTPRRGGHSGSATLISSLPVLAPSNIWPRPRRACPSPSTTVSS
jgi:hypothetical protein